MQTLTPRQRRAEMLIAVRVGTMTVDDVLDEALRTGDRALREMKFHALITAQDGVGDAAATRLLRRLLEALWEKTSRRLP